MKDILFGWVLFYFVFMGLWFVVWVGFYHKLFTLINYILMIFGCSK